MKRLNAKYLQSENMKQTMWRQVIFLISKVFCVLCVNITNGSFMNFQK